MAEKFDVFVGNLTFNTTEEQLREKFSFVGPVKNVRMLTDKETGKPKGFAFVEYYDTNTALSAIRHLDQTELNSRKIKVGYPSQSKLKDAARQIGQIAPESSADVSSDNRGVLSADARGSGGQLPPHQRQQQYQQLMNSQYSQQVRQQMEQKAVDALKLSEAWDVLAAFKELIATDSSNKGQKAKAILEAHPQLISALYLIQQRLGIVLPPHIQEQQQQRLETQSAIDCETEGGGALSEDQQVINQSAAGNGVDIALQLQQLQQLQQQLLFQQQQQQQEVQMEPFIPYDEQPPPQFIAPEGMAYGAESTTWDAQPYFDAYNTYPPQQHLMQEPDLHYTQQQSYQQSHQQGHYGPAAGQFDQDAEYFGTYDDPYQQQQPMHRNRRYAPQQGNNNDVATPSGGRKSRFGSRNASTSQPSHYGPQQQVPQGRYDEYDDDFEASMSAYIGGGH